MDALSQWVNRGLDRHLRLAVTGLSRSGKTAFITSLVNQLLMARDGARLPLFSAVREGRLLGARRVPQRHLGLSRFAYDEGLAALHGRPPAWPSPTQGVSEMQLALRFRPRDALWRHFRETGTLFLEIVDYPGEWLLDLPMLALDYAGWSEQMSALLKGDRIAWAEPWLSGCAALDPLAPADERQLARIAADYTRYLLRCKQHGWYFIQPGRFILPGELADAPALQFFPWPIKGDTPIPHLAQASKTTNIGMLRERYRYYCRHVVGGFYKNHFAGFDRQIVLVDCLQALNSGPQAFDDMRYTLGKLMESFHYGKRTLYRRLFAPRIDKLLFAATKADHITADQHANLVALLQNVIRQAWANAAFDGVAMDCLGLASVQATRGGTVQADGQAVPALTGIGLEDHQPLTCYPGEVPSRLPEAAFWLRQGFRFAQFRPREMNPDEAVPHIRMDSAMEFLLGDKLR
ncbi:YcjX family protein [Martelella alba]|uniref:YcjX family protein n=1 Tax=Martelella alba TaxID=2590451 RepID=A0ABY2SUH7_9HYPH|nr:YcjX family protein [Martelella alba]TKI08094.1 YcjX family protein [Martelella alba]